MYSREKRCIVGRHDGEPISERYLAVIRYRQKQLANNLTKAEKQFDEYIAKAIAADVKTKYKSQVPFFIIDGFAFIADFYFPKFKTVVEIDGVSHRNPAVVEKDAWRDEVLFRTGRISVIRFTNREVLDQMNETFSKFVRFLAEREHATPSHRNYLKKVYSHMFIQ